MPGRPGDGEAWTEVSMVVDAVLGFKAESVTEGEIGAKAPRILREKRAIEEQRAGERIMNSGRYCAGVPARYWGTEVKK